MTVASFAFFINRGILGSGKDIIEKVLFTEDKIKAWYTPILRMLEPALVFISGGTCGIFTPRAQRLKVYCRRYESYGQSTYEWSPFSQGLEEHHLPLPFWFWK